MLRVPGNFYRSAPGSELEEADPCTQLDPSHAHPSPEEAATSSNLCGISGQIAHWNPTQGTQNQNNQRWTSEHIGAQPNHTSNTAKGKSQQAPGPAGNSSTSGDSPAQWLISCDQGVS